MKKNQSRPLPPSLKSQRRQSKPGASPFDCAKDANISLKLFLSVDIVGSTAFKAGGYKTEILPQEKYESVPTSDWERFFIDFYQEFPSSFFQAVSDLKKRVDIWKSLGDELIFVADPENVEEIQTIVRKFVDAVGTFNINYSKSSLRFKGTIWCANFPSPNACVVSPKNQGQKHSLIDYIGPSIDLGFRLAKHASARKLVISAELCLLLLSKRTEFFDFYHDGSVALHGVLNGIHYPIIWIDATAKKDCTAEDNLRGTPCHQKELQDYCDAFIQGTNVKARIATFTPIYRPFLKGLKGFEIPPPDIDSKRNMLASLRYDFSLLSKSKEPKLKSADFKSNIKKRAKERKR